jgi:ribose transport system permease protein
MYLDELLGLKKSIFFLLMLAAVVAVFLHLSIYGRYLYAIGNNERAARYSGIATDRYKLLSYIICSTLAALYGILHLMKYNSAQPTNTGEFQELYAIAGAVLGGCSLRGGEGNVLGVIIGTAILVLLPTLTVMLGFPAELEYIVIGLALLLGAIVDEALRRFGQKSH